MWLAISTRPIISNGVRTVATYYSVTKAIHWKAALGNLAYNNGTSSFGITFQRGTITGISLEVLRTRTTLVRQSIGGLCLTDQLCVEVEVYVGYPGRISMSHFQRLTQSTLPLVLLSHQNVVAFKTGVAFHATR